MRLAYCLKQSCQKLVQSTVSFSMDSLSTLLPAVEHLGLVGYWLVLFVSFAESLAFVGEVVPGGIVVVFAGFLSAKGYFDVGDLIWFAAIGAILGDSVSYWLGSKGTKFFSSESRLLKLSHLEKGDEFFRRHGNKSILLGRFIGPMRPIVPFVAGLFGMKKQSFLFWNVVSGFLWATAYVLLGYFFGGASDAITAWSTRAGYFALLILGVSLTLWFLIRKSRPLFSFLASIATSIRNAIASNPDVQQLIRRHPHLVAFIQRRLNKEKFSGLPLTVLSSAFIYVLFLFFGIIEDIITSDPIVAVDIRVANLLNAFRDMELITFFTWVALLGKWQIVITGTVVATILLWLWRKRIYIVPLWITLVGSEILNLLGKLAFHRPRPDVAYYVEQGFSFPSGHATIAVAFFGFLTYVLVREITHWQRKVTVLFWGLILIFAIGLSRLYLGAHYVSDVWGGYLSGLIFLIIGITLVEWIHAWRSPSLNMPASTRIKVVTGALILAQVSVYIIFALNYRSTPRVSEYKQVTMVENVLAPFQKKTLPQFTETLLGTAQEPLSFIIVAQNDTQFIDAMDTAGWRLADTASIKTIAALAKSAVLKETYATAPMTPSFWNTTPHDLGFEKQTEAQNVRVRHHARFWRTRLETLEGRRVYVGTASFDNGLKWLVTHAISPDIDTERELLLTDLQNAGVVATSSKEQFVTPVLGKNFGGDTFFTDGQVYLFVVKDR